MQLNHTHFVGGLLGLLVIVSAAVSTGAVSSGWLQDTRLGITCGTLKCCAKNGTNCMNIDRYVPPSCDLPSVGKSSLALSVLCLVLSLIAVVICFIRGFHISNSREISKVAGVFFIVTAILFPACWVATIGVFGATCCFRGCTISVGWGYAFSIVGGIASIPCAVLALLRTPADREAKETPSQDYTPMPK